MRWVGIHVLGDFRAQPDLMILQPRKSMLLAIL